MNSQISILYDADLDSVIGCVKECAIGTPQGNDPSVHTLADKKIKTQGASSFDCGGATTLMTATSS